MRIYELNLISFSPKISYLPKLQLLMINFEAVTTFPPIEKTEASFCERQFEIVLFGGITCCLNILGPARYLFSERKF